MMTAIRTTHTGSLPRSNAVLDALMAKERDEPIDPAAFDALVGSAVDALVARQVATGISIVNDGEQSKMTYATYARHRIAGINPVPTRDMPEWEEAKRFPIWAQRFREQYPPLPVDYATTGPLSVKDLGPLEDDLRRLRSAAEKGGASEVFMNAASPGIIAGYIPNQYYDDEEAYLSALVEVLRPEYEAIVAAGFLLQLDCPDLSGNNAPSTDLEAQRRSKELAIDALNAATATIDPQRMRMHLCWGNAQSPHIFDLPLSEVLPMALRARPAMVSFEGGNPRHEHEWAFFESFTLPEDKTIIPGVIDNTTAFVEHPELVAQRIINYARLVGPDRVIAGVDCGFATWATVPTDPDLAFAKLESLVAGAALASARL